MDGSPLLWERVWVKELIPKKSFFLWTAANNGNLTLDNLRRRRFWLPNRCVLCCSKEESVDHIFLHYDFVRAIWSRLWNDLRIQWVSPSSLRDLLIQWERNSGRRTLNEFWSYIPPHLCWAIWKERNRPIFQNHSKIEAEVYQIVKFCINKNLSVCRPPGDVKEEELFKMLQLLSIDEVKDPNEPDLNWKRYEIVIS